MIVSDLSSGSQLIPVLEFPSIKKALPPLLITKSSEKNEGLFPNKENAMSALFLTIFGISDTLRY